MFIRLIIFIQLLIVGFMIFGSNYLPIGDLPQHQAQVELFQRYVFGNLNDIYFYDPFTPYATFNLFAFLPVYIFGSNLGFKIIIYFYFIGYLLLYRAYAKQFQHGAKNIIFIIPILLNINLMWGFLPFLLGLAISLLFILQLYQLNFDINNRRLFFLSLNTIVIYYTHTLAAISNLFIIFLLLIIQKKYSPRILFASLTFAPMFILWNLYSVTYEKSSTWSAVSWVPLYEKFGYLLHDLYSLEYISQESFFMLPALALIPFIYCCKIKNSSALKLAICFLAIYILLPDQSQGIYILYNRYAFLVLFFLLLSFELKKPRCFQISAGIFSLFFISIFYFQFKINSMVLDELHSLSNEVQPNSKILNVIIAQEVKSRRNVLFTHHFFEVLVVEKNAIRVDPAFANLYSMPIRYKKNTDFGFHILENDLPLSISTLAQYDKIIFKRIIPDLDKKLEVLPQIKAKDIL